jgi:hypothetical protein
MVVMIRAVEGRFEFALFRVASGPFEPPYSEECLGGVERIVESDA